ncbi:MAG: hypothetical protein K0R55_4117 [Sporomusa sp.]|jgi:uncharacterized membrane protein YraQ (UPF0718 family)|nr:hypothetical protein [Sporomusa sp.]
MKTHGDMCISRGKIIVIHVFAGILMALIFGLIFGYFVMLLWNNLLPDIFGLKEITYWQGVGLVIMFRLFFGSHGYYKHGQGSDKASHSDRCNSDKDDYYLEWWKTEGQEAFRQYVESQEKTR